MCAEGYKKCLNAQIRMAASLVIYRLNTIQIVICLIQNSDPSSGSDGPVISPLFMMLLSILAEKISDVTQLKLENN